MERMIPVSKCQVFVVGSLQEYRDKVAAQSKVQAGRDRRNARVPVRASMRDLFPRARPVPTIRQFVMGM